MANDSFEALIAEAQKYVIGISSTKEDFIAPEYSPKKPKSSIIVDRTKINEVLKEKSSQEEIPKRKVDDIAKHDVFDMISNIQERDILLPRKVELKDLHITANEKDSPSIADATTVGYYNSAKYGAYAKQADLLKSLDKGKGLIKTLSNSQKNNDNKENVTEETTRNTLENGETKDESNESTSEVVDTDEKASKPPRYTTIVENSPISGLLRTGADAMQNAFDIFFYYPTTQVTQTSSFNKEGASVKDTTLSDLIETSPLIKTVAKITGLSDTGDVVRYFKNLMMPSVFGVRVQSISIPQVDVSTNSVNFLSKAISKQGAPNFNQKGSFSIRTDQNLYIIDTFNYMANQSVLLSGFITEMDLAKKVRSLSLIPNVWSKMRPQVGGYYASDPGLCLIVKLRNLGQKNIDNIVKLTKNENEINDYVVPDDLMPYYVFENVKVLGTDDAINFSNSSPSMGQPMNVQFIFRRLVKVYISDSDDNKTTIKDFNLLGLRDKTQFNWY